MIEFANSKRKPKLKLQSKIRERAIEVKILWVSTFLKGHFIMKYSLT